MTKDVPLENTLAAFETGKRPKGGATSSGIPSLGGEHITAAHGIKLAPMKFVPELFYGAMNKGQIKAGDVLIVKDGATTGRIGMIEPNFPFKDAAVNEHLFLLRPDPNLLDARYLYFYLRSAKGQAEIMSDFRGAAQGGISREIGQKVRVRLSPLDEQRRVAEVLSRAEGIVRLRREAEKKTAELIPALFLDMFGDPATNPKGWPAALLPDVLSRAFKNGLYLPKENYSADGIEMIHMSDAFYGEVKRGGLRRVLANKKQIDDYGLTKSDLLVARRSLTFDGAAKLCGIPDSGDPLLFESSFIRLTPDLAKVRTEFLLYYLNNPSTRQAHVLSRISGVTISGINQAAMNQIPVLTPPLPLQDFFVARVADVRSIQSQQSAATAKAQASFDALLADAFKTRDASSSP